MRNEYPFFLWDVVSQLSGCYFNIIYVAYVAHVEEIKNASFQAFKEMQLKTLFFRDIVLHQWLLASQYFEASSSEVNDPVKNARTGGSVKYSVSVTSDWLP
jgi:hypothetical protein